MSFSFLDSEVRLVLCCADKSFVKSPYLGSRTTCNFFGGGKIGFAMQV